MSEYWFDENTPDEDLRKFLETGEVPQQAKRGNIASQLLRQLNDRPEVDTTQGMSGGDLFLAGAGKAFSDPLITGPDELARTAFGNKADLEKLNAEKKERQSLDSKLMNNWQAKAGNTVGKGVMSLAFPARAGAQMLFSALDSALSPTEGPVKGLPSNLVNRAVQGVEGAASTAIPAVALGATGKVAGAVGQRFTPEGQEAIRLNDAANRIGVKRNVGSLDQSSPLNAFETTLPGYARTVEGQTKAFTEAAKDIIDVPSATGKSVTPRVLDGEKLRRAVVEAGDNLTNQGRSLWNDLDSYVVQNNLAPVSPQLSSVRITDIATKYTPQSRKGPQLDKNPIFQRVAEYDTEAAEMLKWMSQNPANSYGIPFTHLHQIQSAVGKALGRAERDASAPGASMMDRHHKTELKNLYGSLMTDVDNWGTKNPTAKAMYDDAKAFWREKVVPGTMNNKVYSKSSKGAYGMNPRGYSEPSQLYSDVVHNPRAMGELTPHMSPQGRDLTDTLMTMPDVSKALISNNQHPVPSGMGALTQMAGMMVGSPLQFGKAAISHLPGFQSVMQSDPAKKLYFSRNVLRDTPAGRVAWAASQYPQEEIEGGLNRLRTGKK